MTDEVVETVSAQDVHDCIDNMLNEIKRAPRMAEIPASKIDGIALMFRRKYPLGSGTRHNPDSAREDMVKLGRCLGRLCKNY